MEFGRAVSTSCFLFFLLFGTATSIPAMPGHIGVRVVGGVGEFYDTETGETFVPRGANYARWGPLPSSCNPVAPAHWVTFAVGAYDACAAEDALTRMEAEGYNVVRVFIDEYCALRSGGQLNRNYALNFAHFLGRAKAHGIQVLVSLTFLPVPRQYIAPQPGFEWENVFSLTTAGIVAEIGFWRDFIRELGAKGAPLDSVLAWCIKGEMYFNSGHAPLSWTSGTVTAANGLTYDMGDPTDKQRLMDEGLVYYIDQLRTGILAEDPTALVTIGFFSPQEPHPTRVGDPRVIRTYPALADPASGGSSADFIDLHPYPGVELTLAQYVDNFEMAGQTEKPIIMGEFGAWRWAYSVEAAAQALQDWQVESVADGFDGWLLWTWDTRELIGDDMWDGRTECGVIDGALAPTLRPDPAVPGAFPGPVNLARGMPAIATAVEGSHAPGLAVDGLRGGALGTWWSSGGFAPQWIEVDLGQASTIATIRLVASQFPSGPTTHVVWGRGAGAGDPNLQLHVFQGSTDGGSRLEYSPPSPWTGIRYLRIETTSSPSWVSWYEIEAYGPGYPADSDQDGVCDAEDQCPGSDDALDADGDGLPDACDPAAGVADADGDGIGDPCDHCPGLDDRLWGSVPPVLTCPPYVFVGDRGSPGEIVTFSVTATDACDPAPAVACLPPSGSFFPRGTTMVTCTATDSAGNQATCQFPVHVQVKPVRPR